MLESNNDINSIVQAPGYGTGDNKICYGLVMQKNDVDDTYEYLIRYNVTLLTGTSTQNIPNTNGQKIEEIEP